ncbi:MAG: T9SS type A sorting domain-containing protein [Mariniphaga sp.]|nr:T9SS type A sorting domain-containing protein [Mariniphaga sp.]
MKKVYLFIVLNFTSFIMYSQEYKISFAGTGTSNTVETVKVENLTKGTSLTLSGNNVLYLKSSVTGIFDQNLLNNRNIRIYPNPLIDYSYIDFDIFKQQKIKIDVYNISGKKIIEAQNLLTPGKHIYKIVGLQTGSFIVKVSSHKDLFTGKLLSLKTGTEKPALTKLNSIQSEISALNLKSTNNEIAMQYNTGDRLKITGTSGKYSTIITDIPTQNKKLTFTFIECTDVDGNNYPVVQIGTQIWMAKNLITTKFRNGIIIPHEIENSKWRNLSTSAYCNYNNDPNLVISFGRLYNSYCVNDSRNIAPEGWHVPTKEEWSTLIEYVGGGSVAGSKLKSTGTTIWSSTNINATDEFGFSALPGGHRWQGDFEFAQVYGVWWSVSTTFAMYSGYDNVDTGYLPYKTNGCSVRCVKD